MVTYKTNYRRDCSCCGGYITDEQVGFLKTTGEYDSEGNLCKSCYDEQIEQCKDMYRDVIKDVSSKIKPENKVKFDAMDFDKQCYLIDKWMDKGIIKWSIGSK